jgi:isopentenyldiphosphate isomerase
MRFRAGRVPQAGTGRTAGTARTVEAVEGSGEILPVVDPEGRVVGKAPRPLCHAGGAKPLHPVVRLWLTDGSGNFWMQKRSQGKLVQPGKWDCAVGGHVAAGENLEVSLRREAREEIGLGDPGSLTFIVKFIWETAIERELVFVFLATLPRTVSFSPDRAEVDEIRLWSGSELAVAKLDALTELALRELTSIPALSPQVPSA